MQPKRVPRAAAAAAHTNSPSSASTSFGPKTTAESRQSTQSEDVENLIDPLLKTFQRVVDPDIENELDEKILKAIRRQPTEEETPDVYAIVFIAISTSLSPRPIDSRATDFSNASELLTNSRALLDLLVRCVREKKFTDVRNLELLRTPQPVDLLRQDLFSRLSITTTPRVQWHEFDLYRNNAYRYRQEDQEDIDRLPEDALAAYESMEGIFEALKKPRTYTEAKSKHARIGSISEIDIARANYPQQFAQVFKSDPNPNSNRPPDVNDEREFLALFNVLRCYVQENVNAIRCFTLTPITSSFLSNFTHPTLLHPTVSSGRLLYRENCACSIPMIVKLTENPPWLKSNPRNDWDIIARTCDLPLAISRVIPQENRSKDRLDEWRMLLEAVAVSRVGIYMTKSAPAEDKSSAKKKKAQKQLEGSEHKEIPYFLFAVYVDKMLARRYIIKPQDNTKRAKVYMFWKDFDLKEADAASSFLLEMLNLPSLVEKLVKRLDFEKTGALAAVKYEADEMQSLKSEKDKEKETSCETSTTGMETIDFEDADVSHFRSSGVLAVLNQLNYTFGYINATHSTVAEICDKKTGRLVEYLKFVKEGSSELDILTYLASFNTEFNHAIRAIRSWQVNGGTMVSLPVAGSRITHLEDISKHLWGAVHQLVEGVAFLHECNVAHRDIKPHNLIIPRSYGRLTIIDYDISVHLEDPTKKRKSRVGTKGYMAPEIVSGVEYDPFKADLYSCGVVIKELCEDCKISSERDILLEVASQLLNMDPCLRPTMLQVLNNVFQTSIN